MPHQPGRLEPVEQGQRLAVAERAGFRLAQGFGEIRLDHFDFLAFLLHAAALGDARFRRIRRDEEIKLFGGGGRADESFEQEAQIAEFEAHLLHRLAPDAGVGRFAGVERAGAGFEQAGRLVVHKAPSRNCRVSRIFPRAAS